MHYIEWCYFQWPWLTPNPDFKVTPFDAEYLRNGTRCSDIVIMAQLYTQGRHFDWPWVTLSDLATYSMTRSIARSLGDSWTSWLIVRHADINKKVLTFARVASESSFTLTNKTLGRVNAATSTSTRDLQTISVLRERTSTVTYMNVQQCYIHS